MKKCKFCGKSCKVLSKDYCSTCYRYFVLENKKVYPTPEYGQITYNEEGDCICPFCGKAFTKLGMHFYYSHNMSSKEAHIKAGWDISAKASNESYRIKMRDRLQPKCVEINLLEKGKSTRFSKDDNRNKYPRSKMTLDRLKISGKNMHKD